VLGKDGGGKLSKEDRVDVSKDGVDELRDDGANGAGIRDSVAFSNTTVPVMAGSDGIVTGEDMEERSDEGILATDHRSFGVDLVPFGSKLATLSATEVE